MWKQKHVASIVYAFICLMMAACGGSDPVDVSGGIVGTVYDSNNNPLQGVAMTLTPLGKMHNTFKTTPCRKIHSAHPASRI